MVPRENIAEEAVREERQPYDGNTAFNLYLREEVEADQIAHLSRRKTIWRLANQEEGDRKAARSA